MEIFTYCFMPNHVHFVFRDSKEDLMSLLRGFKKYTSKRILKTIEENPAESRKEWLLWMFKKAGKEKGNISKHQFWQHNNKPIELRSTAVIKQKID
ncbi:transposase [Algibacter sp. L4_22]|uniref:transposase n=1 Tax=Algibacter sp. L4_22 TaxID=2942477 RepID=UPI0027D2B575|nr:transposase [Algibacter sp. L4_22]